MEYIIDNTQISIERVGNCQFENYNRDDNDSVRDILPILNNLKSNSSGLVKGVVRFIENGKINNKTYNVLDNGFEKTIHNGLHENIVVSNGRRFVAQRLFNINSNQSEPNVMNYTISHFGIGKSGTNIINSVINVVGPTVCDQDLYEPIPLTGGTDATILRSPGDLVQGVNPTPGVVKPILPTGSIDIISTTDISCSSGTTYSYVRCTCVKSIGEPNYLNNDDDYIMINEAALYYTYGSMVHMFSHICFAPKYPEKQVEFGFEWYMLC